jgi:hypothetical protein
VVVVVFVSGYGTIDPGAGEGDEHEHDHEHVTGHRVTGSNLLSRNDSSSYTPLGLSHA